MSANATPKPSMAASSEFNPGGGVTTTGGAGTATGSSAGGGGTATGSSAGGRGTATGFAAALTGAQSG